MPPWLIALAEFLEALADQGGLKLITAEVDPRGELAQIARSAALDGGPALVFQKVRGCPLPVVANLLASEARAARVLGVDTLAQLAERSEAALRRRRRGLARSTQRSVRARR